jgi:probable selenate reductase FAD-binding subunit
MPAVPSAYHRPHDFAEALKLLQRPDARPLAGGTSLLATPFRGEVVDLQDLGLNQIDWDEADLLTVGAMTRLTDLDDFLAAAGEINGPQSLLRQAIRYAGSNAKRNAATLGGTIAARLPDSELLAALLLLDARLTLTDTAVSLDDYLAAPEPLDGLITAVAIPFTPGQGNLARVARTPADDPIVAVLCWQPENEQARLAAVGLTARPRRLYEAESPLRDGLTPEAIEQAAQAAASIVEATRSDFRGDAAYRAEMAAVLTRRLLAQE